MIQQATHSRKQTLGLDLSDARRAHLPPGHPPVLLVVVDTEEEFDWSAAFSRDNVAVSAIASMVPVQQMFEEIGVRPTYVIDYPVAATKESAAVLRSFARAGVAEVGAHLHPWVTPPFMSADETAAVNSYAGNLSPDVEEQKLTALVAAIEGNIGVRPVTYKAGRYGIAPRTVKVLQKLGFTCDTSSSPSFDWSGDGGPDYRGYPNYPYWIGGDRPLLEIPTTGGWCGPLRAVSERYLHMVENGPARRRNPVKWLLRRSGLAMNPMLTPEGFHLHELQSLTRCLLDQGNEVVSLSFHSPSVAVGHTAFVRSPADQAAFLERIRRYVSWFRDELGGRFFTASELAKAVKNTEC